MDKDYYLLKMKKAIANMPQSIIDKTYNDAKTEEMLWHCIETGDLECFEKIKRENISAIIWKRPFYGENSVRELSMLSENENHDLVSIFITTGERRAISIGVDPVEVMTLCDIMRSEINTNRTNKKLAEISHAFAYSLSELIKAHKQKENGLVGKVKTYVKSNIYKKLSLKSISEELNLNYHTLSSTFSEKTNIPLRTYILTEKCEEAKSLLAKTDKPISEISEDLCFSNQSHFQRVFKENVGITPNEYRKNN